jgi:Ca2+-binding EF-hand superfamily protein
MNKLITIGLVAALCGTALAASAQDTMTKEGMDMKHMDMKPMGLGMGMKAMDLNGDGMISKDEFTKHHEAMWETMKAMDANGDGMISKDEFTKHHEAMWEKMKKDSKGNVSPKDMEAMHDAKMMKK